MSHSGSDSFTPESISHPVNVSATEPHTGTHHQEALGAESEKSFDRITRLAAHLFGVPAAMITFVGPDELWFESAVGIEEIGLGEREMSPVARFCAHTIQSGSPTVVGDAAEDDRFADCSLVTEDPSLRFYAGAPLETSSGSRVGTLCVLGVEPKTPSTAGLGRLEDLAEMVIDQLERHRERQNRHQAREALLRSVTENVSEGIYRSTPEEGLVYANQAFAKMFGYERTKEILQVDPDALYTDPEEREHLLQILQEKGACDALETEFQRRDGTTFTGFLNVTALRDEEGAVKCYDGAITDVTEQKQRERELIRYETVVETLGDGVYMLDPDQRFTFVNEAMTRITGYSREELVGTHVSVLLDEETVTESARTRETLAQKGGDVTMMEGQHVTADGDTFEGEVRFAPFYGEDGEFRGTVGILRNVTERKRQERTLRRRSDAMEATTDGIAIVDGEGTYTYANQAHADIYGYDSPKAFLNETWRICYGEEELRRFEEEVLPRLFEEGAWRGEATGQRADGSPFPQRLTLTRLDTGGMVCVVRDITEQKEVERALREERDRLDRFASILSHDLRNPLNVAKGRLGLVWEENAPDEEGAGHLAAVGRALTRMDEIIQDVLALTWGRQDIDSEDLGTLDLAQLAEACWQNVDTARAALRVDGHVLVEADERRLRHLLENLFRNAVEHGGDEVTIRIGGLPDGFFVEDDGPGIPAEKRGNVFEEGYSSNEEGTGLGLSIAQAIAEGHGWTLSVTDGREGGARFEVRRAEVEAG